MKTNPINTISELLESSASCIRKTVVIAHAANTETISAAVDAQKMLRARCILTGEKEKIEGVVNFAGGTASDFTIIDCPDPQSSLRESIDLLKRKVANILMKGSIDTATMMKAVLSEESGLRSGNLLSDVFVFEYPERSDNKLILLSDGGIVIAPTVDEKVQLIRNAVAVAHALGNMNPKVALLSASEFVSQKVQSSVDAAAIVQMYKEGKITGCVVDGPFALDSAIIFEAAKEKKINSPVAGLAEVLICPNIETANSLAKSTLYFAHYPQGHVVVGAKMPILIPSRADTREGKLVAIALGMLMCSSEDD